MLALVAAADAAFANSNREPARVLPQNDRVAVRRVIRIGLDFIQNADTHSAGGYGGVRIGTEYYGSTVGEIGDPACGIPHSPLHSGPNNAISVPSVSSVFSVFHVGFQSVNCVGASNVEP